MTTPLLRSYLYVPGDRPGRIDTALRSAADAVVIDLEDAVLPDRKGEARANAAKVLAGSPPVPVFVRINGGSLGDADVDEIANPHLRGVRVPKVQSASCVDRVAEALDRKQCRAAIHGLVETALGVENAFELALHPRVGGLSLGETDLRTALGVTDDRGLDWARSRLVVACAAAGLPAPVQSVFANVRDLDGLRASTLQGRTFGFFGRSAIHPDQLSIINDAFTPTEDDVAWAHQVLNAHQSRGTTVLEDGTFVDTAVVLRAQALIDLVERLSGGRT